MNGRSSHLDHGAAASLRLWAAARALLLPLAGASLVTAGVALAAQGSGNGPSVELLFAQIVILILVGRGLGELMQRVGQPAVIGQLLGGLLLGPSILGVFAPSAEQALFPAAPEQKAMLDAIAQVGILLLLLLTGMETDLQLVRKVGRPAVVVSAAGILVPFAFGVALGEFLPDALLPKPEARLVTSLFLGTALAISSVKIVAMVVREMHFMRRDVGQIILSAAITDDTVGWIIIAITFSLAQTGAVEPWPLARSILGTAAFLLFSLTIGRGIVFRVIRWSNDYFVSEVPVISAIFVLMGVMALITYLIGVHTVLGAFVAGVLVGQSPILTKQVDAQLRGMITGFFAPVFFGLAGLTADLKILNSASLILLAAVFILIASLGKFTGAFIGGKLGGLTMRESTALASGMNARGSTEVIVATIGLSLGMLSEALFTMIVAMAVVTTMAMPPMLRWALSRVPLRSGEKRRLEREAFEARAFVPNLERLLLALDESGDGRLGARIAGLIAGPRGIPVTLIEVGKKNSHSARNKAAKQEISELVENVAGRAAERVREEGSGKGGEPNKVDIIARILEGPAEKAVKREARRGYGLLLIGFDRPVSPRGAFREEVSRLATGFGGPLGVAIAHGKNEKRLAAGSLKILVAASGTDVSRRAAEIGVALARAERSDISALHVRLTKDDKKGGRESRTKALRQEQAVLQEIEKMAEHYGQPIKTSLVRGQVAPAIVEHAREGDYELLIMGADRYAGERLFFGETVAAVMKKAPCSMLILSTDTFSEKLPDEPESDTD